MTMKTLTFKVEDEEARRLRSRARREGLTLSEFLRRRAQNDPVPPPAVQKVRCPRTGVMIFSGVGTGPLTTESVRNLLDEFP